MTSSRAGGRASAEEGHPLAVSRSEFALPTDALALSGRYAYVLEFSTGGWSVFSRFNVFDIIDRAQRASIVLEHAPCVEVDGEIAYLGGYEFRILDLSDPTVPQIVGSYPAPQYVSNIAVVRPFAYLADWGGLHVFDISDPASPSPVGNLATQEPVQSVAVNGSYAYAAAGDAGLLVVNISDPESPSVVGTCDLPGPAWDIAIRGSRAYVADGTGLLVIDVSRRAEPRLIGSAVTPGDARKVALHGARAYVVDRETDSNAYDGGVRIIDIANPRDPVIVNSIVDDPVMEDECYERHADPVCVGVNGGRVAVAGTILHLITACDCPAGSIGCDYVTGYLDLGSASSYEALPRRSWPSVKLSGPPPDGPLHDSGTTIPDKFVLRENEPNPFNPETLIRFDVPRSSRIRIRIYDAGGRLVQTLVDDTLPPGSHEVSWRGRQENGQAVASGIYFVTMEAENVRQTMKITLLK